MEFFQETPRQGIICNYGIADHFKTNYFSADFILPLTVENASGMSLLAGVLSRGCAKLPEMNQISRYLAKNYGMSFSVNADKAGELESLSFSFSFLDNAFAIEGEDIRKACFDLFRELVFNPLVADGGFKADYVAQEKTNLSDRIDAVFNDKRQYALERCRSIMCENEQYGISAMGTKEYLNSFDEKSLYRFFCKMLQESLVVFSYIGKEKGAFLEELAGSFSPRNGVIPKTDVIFSCDTPREISEPMDLNQSKMNIGFRLGEYAFKNGAACRLFNVLYGGSASSKLFMNVREKLSLCYYCSSAIDRLKNVMFVISGVEADRFEDARDEVMAQLKAVADGDFTDEEFENAKNYLIDSIRGAYDSQSLLASILLYGTLRGELKTPEEDMAEISNVTRSEVISVAKGISLDTVYLLKGVHQEE